MKCLPNACQVTKEFSLVRATDFGKGTQRGIQQIRWTRREIVRATFFFLMMLAFSIFIGLWVISHPFD